LEERDVNAKGEKHTFRVELF